MASASVLIVLLVSTAVGGVAGLSLGDVLSGPWLAIISGFLGVVAAAVARNYLMTPLAKTRPDNSGIPMMIVVFAAVASLAGSMAAFELVREFGSLRSGIVGGLAGLISGALMSMLMAAYHMNVHHQPGH